LAGIGNAAHLERKLAEILALLDPLEEKAK
jgi:hypothetical protein